MQTTEFINFYANVVWQQSLINKVELMHCQYSPSDKYVQILEGSRLLQNWLSISSQEELGTIFKKKQLFLYNQSNVVMFSKELFISSTQEQFCYFINHYEKLMTDISLESLSNILPLLTHEKILYLLENAKDNIGYLNYRGHYSAITSNQEPIMGLNVFLKTMRNIPNVETALAKFLYNRYEQINHERDYLKHQLLSIFPHKLKKLSLLPNIEQYLSSQDKDVFNTINETIAISINFSILKEKICLHHFNDVQYKEQLLTLFNSLIKNKLGIKTIELPYSKNFLYDDIRTINIYINFEKNDLQLVKEDIENMLTDYLSYLQSQDAQVDFKGKLKIDTNKWVDSYIKSFKLEKELVAKLEGSARKKI